MIKNSVIKSVMKGILVPILIMALSVPSTVPVFADGGNSFVFYTPEELDKFRLKNTPKAWGQPSAAEPHNSNWNKDAANIDVDGRTASAAYTSDGKLSEGFIVLDLC